MTNYLLDENDFRLIEILKCIKNMQKKLCHSNKKKRTFYDEVYYTDKELSEKLKISRRTLQEWRNKGKISFYLMGGKVLYKEMDIITLLNENYQKIW